VSVHPENATFEAFASIPRLKRECVISEKIDGSNGQIYIADSGVVLAGSRGRWLTVEADNFGFAHWVKDHEDELRTLGPGRHFGEWYGAGIQRRYGLAEKRFALFNTARWSDDRDREKYPIDRPACCHVVPVLYAGPFSLEAVDEQLKRLELGGSVAALGFMQPEGVVVFHAASGHLYKVTLGDDGHKCAPRGSRPVAPEGTVL
jgi:hypothetical protein